MKINDFLMLIVFLLFKSSALSSQVEPCKSIGHKSYALADSIFDFNIDSSIIHYKNSIEEFRHDNCHIFETDAMIMLGNVYYINAEYEEAESITKESLKRLEEYNLVHSESYLDALNNFATFQAIKNNFISALETNLSIYEKCRTQFLCDSLSMAITLNNIGLNYSKIGDLPKAMSYFEMGLMVLKNKDEEFFDTERGILANLGIVYFEKSNFEKALKIFSALKEPIEKLKNKKSYSRQIQYTARIIECLMNLDRLDLIPQKLDELDYYIEKVPKRKFKSDFLKGLYYSKINQLEKASIWFKNSLHSHSVAYPNIKKSKNRFRIYEKFYNLSKSFKTIEDFDTLLIQTTFENQFELNDKILLYTEALNVLSLKYTFAKKKMLDWKELTNILNDMSVVLNLYRQKLRLNNNVRETIPIQHLINNEMLWLCNKNNSANKAFTYINANKSTILDEASQIKQKLKKFNIPDTIKEQYFELQADVSFYNTKVLEEKSKVKPNEKKLDKLELTLLDKKTKYEHLIRSYNITEILGNSEYTLESTQEKLEDNEVLLEYFMGDQNYLFALSKTSHEFIQLDTTINLDSLCRELKQELSQVPNDDFVNNQKRFVKKSHQIYHTLFSQLEMDLNGKNLIIVPDGILNEIPFEILLKSDSPESNTFDLDELDYLFEDHSISYAYNLSSIFDNRDTEYDADYSFLGIAPEFQGELEDGTRTCNENILSELYCAKEEVNELNSIFDGLTYTDQNATIDQLFDKNYSIVHLATHACVDYDNPELSKIFFTDEYLSSHDLIDRNLNTDLTVLSACSTGNGQYIEGDGIATMAKDFMYAGSKSLVTSLWNVDDCSTKDLMVHFYKNLKEGQSKTDAMKNAKTQFLQNSETAFTHPFYWSSFVLVGDTGAIVESGGMWTWVVGIVLIIGLLALLLFFFKNRE